MTSIENVTLKNNAMFNIVMSRPGLCIKCLERILNKKIERLDYIDSERTIDLDIEAKSIRLDVYCEDEETAYNVELQNGIFDNLPKRSRYYQGLIDIDLIKKGCDYSELKNNIVIFICTFDLFDDIPKPLANFLNYIDSGEVTDEYTKELDETVIEVSKDERWKKRMMTVEELMNAMAKKERKEAKEDAIRKIEESVSEGLITREVADAIIAKFMANPEKSVQ